MGSLCRSAEALADEVLSMELAVAQKEQLPSWLGVSRPLWALIQSSVTPGQPLDRKRFMRFDFHPTDSGWRVSEVNSDVPGGWGEATSLPILHALFHPTGYRYESPLAAWGEMIAGLAPCGHIAILSAPGYLEDEESVRAFIRQLRRHRISSVAVHSLCALTCTPAGHLSVKGTSEKIALVVRFYQAEWLASKSGEVALSLAKTLNKTAALMINPFSAAVSESKRFGLAFNELPDTLWRSLVPESRDARDLSESSADEWVIKETFSNTGDSVFFLDSLVANQRRRLLSAVRRHPARWVLQKRFRTSPLESARGLVYPCIGIYVVDGRAVGAYVRLAQSQLTNKFAMEAPLFIEDRHDP